VFTERNVRQIYGIYPERLSDRSVKRLFGKFKDKLITFLKWVVAECKDWHTIVLLMIVAAVLFTPVWGGFLLWMLFHIEWGFFVATASIAILIGPVPFWVISIAITLGIKRLFEKKQEHDAELLHAQEGEAEQDTIEQEAADEQSAEGGDTRASDETPSENTDKINENN
jgi:hypothetical protein